MTPHSLDPAWETLDRQRAAIGEIRELLVRLDAKMEAMGETLRSFGGETGLPRCALRGERINQLEARLAERLADPARLPGGGAACVEHRDRLGTLETRLEQLCSRLWRLAASLALALAMLAAETFWKLVTS